MGAKNPDRIPVDAWRVKYPTVAELARDHVEVISSCRKCGLIMPVDLDLVARISGPATNFWNRKARCKRIGCSGFVEFQAKFRGTYTYQTLAADDREPGHGR
jgi:hypothetical protein